MGMFGEKEKSVSLSDFSISGNWLTSRIQSQSWRTGACERPICINTRSSSSAYPHIQVTFIYICTCLSIHLYNKENTNTLWD